jgi:sec-independent protein translocase protein TatA
MFDVGGGELLLIVLVVILLFGPKKIPEVAQQVGKGIRQFRRAQEDLKQQIRDISAEISVEDQQHAQGTQRPSYTPAEHTVAAAQPQRTALPSDESPNDEEPPSQEASQPS